MKLNIFKNAKVCESFNGKGVSEADGVVVESESRAAGSETASGRIISAISAAGRIGTTCLCIWVCIIIISVWATIRGRGRRDAREGDGDHDDDDQDSGNNPSDGESVGDANQFPSTVIIPTRCWRLCWHWRIVEIFKILSTKDFKFCPLLWTNNSVE